MLKDWKQYAPTVIVSQNEHSITVTVSQCPHSYKAHLPECMIYCPFHRLITVCFCDCAIHKMAAITCCVCDQKSQVKQLAGNVKRGGMTLYWEQLQKSSQFSRTNEDN